MSLLRSLVPVLTRVIPRTFTTSPMMHPGVITNMQSLQGIPHVANHPAAVPPSQWHRFLRISSPSFLQMTNSFKTKSSVRRRCKDCYFVYRKKRLFVICKTHPRHKQRQG